MKRAIFALAVAGTLGSAMARADGDRAETERVIAAVEQDAAAPAARDALASSRRALERAQGARDAGDAHHAEQLEALARLWAETARDVLAAAKAEGDAATLQQKVDTTRAQADRQRALVEETISRRGRAEAELRRAQEDASSKPPTAAPRDKAAKKSGGKKAKK